MNKFLDPLRKQNEETFKNSIILSQDKNGKIAEKHFNVIVLPETFIIDKTGTIRYKIVGADFWKNKEQVLELLKSIL